MVINAKGKKGKKKPIKNTKLGMNLGSQGKSKAIANQNKDS